MNKLDFSGINKIAYQSFEDKDSLLQEGYTVVNTPDNPFTDKSKTRAKPEQFTDHTGGRNYNRYYRIAHNYHEKHSPPVVDVEYWKMHTPGVDSLPEAEDKYWMRAAQELGESVQSGGDDSFLMDLLLAVYSEVEREYKAMWEEAHKTA